MKPNYSKSLEDFKKTRSEVWEKKNSDYNIAVVLLFYPGGLSKEKLKRLTEVRGSEFEAGLARRMEKKDLILNKSSRVEIYSLSPDLRAWLERSL